MARKVCFTLGASHRWPIQLIQLGKDHFEVRYGLQVDTGLDYAQGAAKLGEAIMHQLACDGALDNRMKGER